MADDARETYLTTLHDEDAVLAEEAVAEKQVHEGVHKAVDGTIQIFTVRADGTDLTQVTGITR